MTAATGSTGADGRLHSRQNQGDILDRSSRTNRALALLSLVTATSLALTVPVSAQESFKLGIVTFLSGPAADSFGVPAATAPNTSSTS
jgi:hypothetical protein